MNIYFGENLKKLRQERNLTQERLAEFLGVSFQTISKWERGDNYPDITMLPEIASFFKISVDNLLGVNRAEDEKEITEMLYSYDNHNDKDEAWKIISSLKERYPNDYRVLVRYMGYHISYTDCRDSHKTVQSVYDNIISNCTEDNIRSCAKRFIVQHYRNMAEYKDSGVTLDDIEKVLSTMPYMRDGKDFISCLVYRKDKNDGDINSPHYAKCKEAIEELLGLLNDILEWSTVWTGEGHLDYNISLVQTMNTIFNMFYNKNYGRQWCFVINNYLHLGYLYMLKGNYDNTIANYQKAKELAKEFDSLDDVTILDSTFLSGQKFVKKELGSTFIAISYVRQWIEKRQENYPKELTERNDFRELLKFLKI